MIALATLLLLAGIQESAPKAKRFNARDYPGGEISQRRYPHGDVAVRITQVKSFFSTESHACRAWLEVQKDGRTLRQRYFDDIEPVGYSFGIFVPKKQPFEDYFVAVKEGDYDGRLFMVAKDGGLNDFPGGMHFVTPEGHFIIGNHMMDLSAVVVIDVQRRKLVYDGEKDENIPSSYKWYQDSEGYFYTEEDPKHDWPAPELRDHVFRMDLEHFRVVRQKISAKKLSAAHHVPYDFDPREKKDCFSAPQ